MPDVILSSRDGDGVTEVINMHSESSQPISPTSGPNFAVDSSSATSTSLSRNTSQSLAGPIIGAVVGGLAVLILLIYVVMACIKRRKEHRYSKVMSYTDPEFFLNPKTEDDRSVDNDVSRKVIFPSPSTLPLQTLKHSEAHSCSTAPVNLKLPITKSSPKSAGYHQQAIIPDAASSSPSFHPTGLIPPGQLDPRPIHHSARVDFTVRQGPAAQTSKVAGTQQRRVLLSPSPEFRRPAVIVQSPSPVSPGKALVFHHTNHNPTQNPSSLPSTNTPNWVSPSPRTGPTKIQFQQQRPTLTPRTNPQRPLRNRSHSTPTNDYSPPQSSASRDGRPVAFITSSSLAPLLPPPPEIGPLKPKSKAIPRSKFTNLHQKSKSDGYGPISTQSYSNQVRSDPGQGYRSDGSGSGPISPGMKSRA
ncbi:hypothetical protein C8Q75DRAFT_808102 [Abortiporus biennis]|nr:hypothetical protein C8Q75DRAFT_808102 [Abortiporus biennis]